MYNGRSTTTVLKTQKLLSKLHQEPEKSIVDSVRNRRCTMVDQQLLSLRLKSYYQTLTKSQKSPSQIPSVTTFFNPQQQ
jgi:hypothetical protein